MTPFATYFALLSIGAFLYAAAVRVHDGANSFALVFCAIGVVMAVVGLLTSKP